MQLQKCFFERRLKIVKQIEKRFWIYILECMALCAILLFGIFYGPQYPNLFFWGFMGIFAVIVAIELTPTKKETIILLVGMAVSAIVGTLVNKLVVFLLGEDSLLGFILSLILLAPIYFPLAGYFYKICQKAVRKMKQEELKNKNN